MDILGQVLVSFLVSVGTAWITAIFYGRKTKADLRKEYAARLHDQRWNLYKDFLEFVGSQAALRAEGEPMSQADRHDMLRLMNLILLSGSKQVCWHMSDIVNILPKLPKGGTSDTVLEAIYSKDLQGLLNAMREDLGFDAVNWEAEDLKHM